MSSVDNLHASCVVLGDRGLLIGGKSGSGKTTLALALIDRWRAGGRFARLVADDRVLVRERFGRIIGRAPDAIAGLAEAYGLGPRPIETEAETVIDLVVELVAEQCVPRFDEGQTRSVRGCELPLLMLAERNAEGAALAISARLDRSPFL